MLIPLSFPCLAKLVDILSLLRRPKRKEVVSRKITARQVSRAVIPRYSLLTDWSQVCTPPDSLPLEGPVHLRSKLKNQRACWWRQHTHWLFFATEEECPWGQQRNILDAFIIQSAEPSYTYLHILSSTLRVEINYTLHCFKDCWQ